MPFRKNTPHVLQSLLQLWSYRHTDVSLHVGDPEDGAGGLTRVLLEAACCSVFIAAVAADTLRMTLLLFTH